MSVQCIRLVRPNLPCKLPNIKGHSCHSWVGDSSAPAQARSPMLIALPLAEPRMPAPHLPNCLPTDPSSSHSDPIPSAGHTICFSGSDTAIMQMSLKLSILPKAGADPIHLPLAPDHTQDPYLPSNCLLLATLLIVTSHEVTTPHELVHQFPLPLCPVCS